MEILRVSACFSGHVSLLFSSRFREHCQIVIYEADVRSNAVEMTILFTRSVLIYLESNCTFHPSHISVHL